MASSESKTKANWMVSKKVDSVWSKPILLENYTLNSSRYQENVDREREAVSTNT